jgi:hypothetical protein
MRGFVLPMQKKNQNQHRALCQVGAAILGWTLIYSMPGTGPSSGSVATSFPIQRGMQSYQSRESCEQAMERWQAVALHDMRNAKLQVKCVESVAKSIKDGH